MSEEKWVKYLGAKPVKNSGRGENFKGDCTLDDMTIDIKEYSKSFSISKTNWAKLCQDAYRNRTPYAGLFVVLDGETKLWVISDEHMREFLVLQERYEDLLMDYNNVIECTYE